jgi:RNA polymerase sigma factor for flagellar operon FliA
MKAARPSAERAASDRAGPRAAASDGTSPGGRAVIRGAVSDTASGLSLDQASRGVASTASGMVSGTADDTAGHVAANAASDPASASVRRTASNADSHPTWSAASETVPRAAAQASVQAAPTRRGVGAPRVVEHLPLVRAIAARLYRARWSDALPFEEYVQMGAVGLMEASQRYDAGRGVPFGAFASWRIAGSILQGLERATEHHQQVAVRRRLVSERLASLGGERPESPTGAALERRLARIAAVAVGLAVGFMLEGTGMYSDGAEVTPMDGCAVLATRDLARQLCDVLQDLPIPERRVLEEHYFQQRPFADIALALHLSRGRVAQIHKRGIAQLRERLCADAWPSRELGAWA